jgi:hypothetical protein
MAAPIVEDSPGPSVREKPAEHVGIPPGARFQIVRVDEQILLVVDVIEEIRLGEMVERRREDELAGGTTVVIDGHARDVEDPAPAILAVLVEVHDAVGYGQGTAALALLVTGADGLQSGGHDGSPAFAPSPETGDRSIVEAGRPVGQMGNARTDPKGWFFYDLSPIRARARTRIRGRTGVGPLRSDREGARGGWSRDGLKPGDKAQTE